MCIYIYTYVYIYIYIYIHIYIYTVCICISSRCPKIIKNWSHRLLPLPGHGALTLRALAKRSASLRTRPRRGARGSSRRDWETTWSPCKTKTATGNHRSITIFHRKITIYHWKITILMEHQHVSEVNQRTQGAVFYSYVTPKTRGELIYLNQ